MAKQNVQFSKAMLLSIWILRTLLGLFFMIAFSLALKITDKESLEGAPGILAFVVILYLVVIGVILLDMLQMTTFIRGGLRPTALLVINSVQTFFWGAILLTDVVLSGGSHGAPVGLSGLGLLVPMFLLFLALFVYATMMFYSQRQAPKEGRHESA